MSVWVSVNKVVTQWTPCTSCLTSLFQVSAPVLAVQVLTNMAESLSTAGLGDKEMLIVDKQR